MSFALSAQLLKNVGSRRVTGVEAWFRLSDPLVHGEYEPEGIVTTRSYGIVLASPGGGVGGTRSEEASAMESL